MEDRSCNRCKSLFCDSCRRMRGALFEDKWELRTSIPYKFMLTPEQVLKHDAWKKTLPPPEPPTAIGGADTFTFTPTGLGVIVTARYRIPGCEVEIDLTNYKEW